MKKDISGTIAKLERIYTEIPDDFALQDARFFCRKAINEMKETQKKRVKRETQIQQQEKYFLDLNSAKLALKEIDKMIEMENKNLNKPIKEKVKDSDQFLIG